jgi:hypothetical protein
MRYALATWEVRDLLLIPSFMFSESAVIKRPPLAATARRAGWVGCNIDLHRIAPEARIAIVITRSSPAKRDESAPSSSGESRESQSRLTSAATIIVPPEEVRAKYKRVKPLENISVTQRGWTLDVLNIVRRLCEVGTARCAVRAPSGRKIPAAIPPVTSQPVLRSITAEGGRDVPTKEFTIADVYAFERELEKLHPDNPVNNRVTRGRPARKRQDSPAIAAVTRCRIIAPRWPWRMALAIVGRAVLPRRQSRQSSRSAPPFHVERGVWRLPQCIPLDVSRFGC